MADDDTSRVKRVNAVHPLIVRITHWVNAFAIAVMLPSGLAIHNAYPIMPFKFPGWMTLGGGLTGGLLWHFAAMWLLAANGVIYVIYGLMSGRFRRNLLPVTPGAVVADMKDALSGRLRHGAPGTTNAVQRALYLLVIFAGITVTLSGIALWKPVQFQELTSLFGGFDNARIVHFAAMAFIAAFALIHIAMAVLVPRTLRAMIIGR